jgi:serine/threonine-protein kinase
VSAPDKKGLQKIGKYTLGKQLGHGAFGDVFLASWKEGNVAIKILDAAAARDEEAVARFKREAETAQRLEHPNVVRVIDVGSARGRHYIVMEVVRGGSLRELLDAGADPQSVLHVLAETASALAHAHDQGIVHRDVKPENVLLTRSRHAKVADFGLARAVDQKSMTTDGRLMGTALYMSPEQCKGARATGASDVYALGVLIYEAVTGARPFDGDQAIALIYQHAEVEPRTPRARPPYPPSLGGHPRPWHAKDPRDRPTMKEVAARLAATTLLRRRRFLRPAVIAPAALVLLVALTILVPSVLSPLCGDWFGGGVFRGWRRGAHAVHVAIFGGGGSDEHEAHPAKHHR